MAAQMPKNSYPGCPEKAAGNLTYAETSVTMKLSITPPFPVEELLKKLAELRSAVNTGKDSL
jgi:hypothetical protein